MAGSRLVALHEALRAMRERPYCVSILSVKDTSVSTLITCQVHVGLSLADM